jgi:broad specificity phosphatase PhoE
LIWLARHGETTWNVAGRYQGRLESTLTPLGERQATALAAYFVARAKRGEAVPERIRSSPLLRCTATAQPSAAALGLPIERDESLIEIGHGTWEGRYREEIAREDAERYRSWREEPARVAFDGGETLAEVLARWRTFATGLARDTRHTLVTTHDAVLRCALLDLLGRPLDDFWKVHVENGAFALLANDGRQLSLAAECEVDHLRGLRAEVSEQAL